MHICITDPISTNKKEFVYNIEIIEGSAENRLIIVKIKKKDIQTIGLQVIAGVLL